MEFLMNHWHCIVPIAVIIIALFLLNGGNGTGRKKKTGGLVLCAVVVVLAVCAAVVIWSGKVSDADSKSGQKNAAAAVIEEGGALVIPVSDVTDDVSFFPVEVDDTEMEIIAVRDSAGAVRMAFNTCQVCYSSGRGYYVLQGDVLVCQNCGNRFTVDQVGIESGGCNPWPIFESDITVTDDSIEISYDFLKASQDIFANWKASY